MPPTSSSSSSSSSCSSSGSSGVIGDYYSILGVSSDATLDDIRHAFYDICRRYHPDKVLINNNKQEEPTKNNNKENNNIDNKTTITTSHSSEDDDNINKEDDDDELIAAGVGSASSSLSCSKQPHGTRHAAAAGGGGGAACNNNYSLEHWTAIQTAWKCLSNKTKRVIYDIRREGRIVNKDDSNKLLLLMKEQADKDINNMKHEYNIILDRENKKNGVIIKNALFGNLNIINNNVEGPYINVTIPLQCAVDTHKVILAGGIAKADLPGFYNPIPLYKQKEEEGMVASLYVLYEFKGKLHEVTVNEMEPLWLPLKAHAILDNIKGPQQQEQQYRDRDDREEEENNNNNNNGVVVDNNKDSSGRVSDDSKGGWSLWWLKDNKDIIVSSSIISILAISTIAIIKYKVDKKLLRL